MSTAIRTPYQFSSVSPCLAAAPVSAPRSSARAGAPISFEIAHVAPFGSGEFVFVEGSERRVPVLARRRTPERGDGGARRQRDQTARRDPRRQLGDHRFARPQVHQHAKQQHRIVALALSHRAETADRALAHSDAAPTCAGSRSRAASKRRAWSDRARPPALDTPRAPAGWTASPARRQRREPARAGPEDDGRAAARSSPAAPRCARFPARRASPADRRRTCRRCLSRGAGDRANSPRRRYRPAPASRRWTRDSVTRS